MTECKYWTIGLGGPCGMGAIRSNEQQTKYEACKRINTLLIENTPDKIDENDKMTCKDGIYTFDSDDGKRLYCYLNTNDPFCKK